MRRTAIWLQHNLVVAFCFFVWIGSAVPAQDRKVERSPLPTAILTAKSVFVANAGGSDLAFDTVYSELKLWARYALVDDPAKSDLVFEVSFLSGKTAPARTYIQTPEQE